MKNIIYYFKLPIEYELRDYRGNKITEYDSAECLLKQINRHFNSFKEIKKYAKRNKYILKPCPNGF